MLTAAGKSDCAMLLRLSPRLQGCKTYTLSPSLVLLPAAVADAATAMVELDVVLVPVSVDKSFFRQEAIANVAEARARNALIERIFM
jgi:hypothetical protein